LAPVQVVGIPVADSFADYLGGVIKQMKAQGIRAELDDSDDRMQKKVRNAQMQKIPFMVIAGEEDMKAGAVSFRYRNGDQKNGIPVADAISEIKETVASRLQV
jgi:threonyl-tRNA synthetase